MTRSKIHFPFTGQDVLEIVASGKNAVNKTNAMLAGVNAEIYFHEQSASMYRALGINPPGTSHLRELKAQRQKINERLAHLLRVTGMFHNRIASKVCRSCAGKGKQFKRLSPFPSGVHVVACDDCKKTGMQW